MAHEASVIQGTSKRATRTYASVTPGICILGLAPFGVDPLNTDFVLQSAGHRWARETPPLDYERFSEFAAFSIKLIRDLTETMIPVVSFSSWLDHLPRPERDKQQLRDLYTAGQKPRVQTSRSFVKDEFYASFHDTASGEQTNRPKPARWINPQSDTFLVTFGPLLHALEVLIFTHPCFVKYLTPTEKARSIASLVGDLLGTDFTSFESAHCASMWFMFFAALLPMVQRALVRDYAYLPAEAWTWYIHIVASVNRCGIVSLKLFIAVISRLRSGDPGTSLFNTLLNFCLLCFAYWKTFGRVPDYARLLRVDGDDGKIAAAINLAFLRGLGVTVKPDVRLWPRSPPFCSAWGVEGALIYEPLGRIMRFFWLRRRHIQMRRGKQLALLWARALSMSYECSGCPLLGVLSHRVLDLLPQPRRRDDFWMRHLGSYEYTLFKRATRPPLHISPAAREMMAVQLNIDVDTQLACERELSRLAMGDNICPMLEHLCGTFAWRKYVHPLSSTRKFFTF